MWLLEHETLQRLTEASNNITQEQQENFLAKVHDIGSNPSPEILTISNKSATICIEGVLTNKPDFFAFLFGGGNTTYQDIISAVKIAENDSAVENIFLAINSPGGDLDGLFEVIEVLQQATKPIAAVVSNLCASAAFAIAAQANSIQMSNLASRVGSIGVLVSYYVDDNEVIITSSNAPKKSPNVKTTEGILIVQEQLNAMHKVFVDAIAVGRGTTAENINQNFGQGAVFLAEKALEAGMVDSIASFPKKTTQLSSKKTGEKMDIVTLMAEHRDVYEAVFKMGVADERDRVSAHLTMGTSSGDMETAIQAIEDGSDMTRNLTAKYLAAGMNKQDISAKEEDNPEFKADSEKKDDIDSQVATIVETKTGIKTNG